MTKTSSDLKTDWDKYAELLGLTAEDRITKLRGVISSLSFDVTGCVQVTLMPPVVADGKIPDGRWVDVHRLLVDKAVPRVMPVPRFAATPAEHSKGPVEKP